jgi:hypothetical protein
LWIRIPVIPVTSAENLALIFLGFVAAFDRSFNSEWQEAILDLVELLKIEFPKNLEERPMVCVSFALGLKLTDNNSYNNTRIIV